MLYPLAKTLLQRTSSVGRPCRWKTLWLVLLRDVMSVFRGPPRCGGRVDGGPYDLSYREMWWLSSKDFLGGAAVLMEDLMTCLIERCDVCLQRTSSVGRPCRWRTLWLVLLGDVMSVFRGLPRWGGRVDGGPYDLSYWEMWCLSSETSSVGRPCWWRTLWLVLLRDVMSVFRGLPRWGGRVDGGPYDLSYREMWCLSSEDFLGGAAVSMEDLHRVPSSRQIIPLTGRLDAPESTSGSITVEVDRNNMNFQHAKKLHNIF